MHVPRWPGLSPGAHKQGGGCGLVLCCCREQLLPCDCGQAWQVLARAVHVCAGRLSRVASVFITPFPRPLDSLATEGKQAGKNIWVGFFLCFSLLLDYFHSCSVVYQDSLVVIMIMQILNNLLFPLYC